MGGHNYERQKDVLLPRLSQILFNEPGSLGFLIHSSSAAGSVVTASPTAKPESDLSFWDLQHIYSNISKRDFEY